MKKLTQFQFFLLIMVVSFVMFLFISFSSFGRVRTGLPKGYAAMSLGYVPLQSNTGSLSCNLTVGYGNTYFIEYGQIASLSSSIYSPKFFLLRSGYSFRSKELEFRPFIGGGVMPSASLEAKHKANVCFTGGFYLLQDIGKDFRIKYEIGIVNKYFCPSIGLNCNF